MCDDCARRTVGLYVLSPIILVDPGRRKSVQMNIFLMNNILFAWPAFQDCRLDRLQLVRRDNLVKNLFHASCRLQASRASRPKRVFLSFLGAAGAPRIRKSPSFEPLTFWNRGAGRSFSYTRRVMAAASRLGSTSLVILTISPSSLSASTKDRNSRCGAAAKDMLIDRTRAAIRNEGET